MDDVELEIKPDPSEDERRAILAALARQRDGSAPPPSEPDEADE